MFLGCGQDEQAQAQHFRMHAQAQLLRSTLFENEFIVDTQSPCSSSDCEAMLSLIMNRLNLLTELVLSQSMLILARNPEATLDVPFEQTILTGNCQVLTWRLGASDLQCGMLSIGLHTLGFISQNCFSFPQSSVSGFAM